MPGSCVSFTTMDLAVKKVSASSENSLGADDAEEFIWSVVEMIAEAGGSGVSAVVQLVHFLRSAGQTIDDEDAGDSLVPNPYFVVNGHGGTSTYTKKYLRNRGFKNLGGAAVGIAGGLGSGVTQVDVLSGIKHGSAMVSTGAHMYNIYSVGKRFKGSETITGWVSAIQKAKAAKMAMRGTSFAGAVIPVGGLGLATGAATAIAGLGIKLTMGKLVARTAMEIHWRARQETQIGSILPGASSGPQGPASAMVHELFTRRCVTRIFGTYDVSKVIQEPGGWLAVNDKLILM